MRNSKQEVGLPVRQNSMRFFLLVGLFVVANPSKTSTYDFRHISVSEGMTISVPRTAPPLAALEDLATPVRAEAIETQTEVHPRPGQQLLVAGQVDTWRVLGASLARASVLASLKQVRHSRRPAFVATASRSKRRFRPIHLSHYEVAMDTHSVAAQNFDNRPMPSITHRDQIEAPLKAPSVERALPRGEEPVYETLPVPQRALEGATATAAGGFIVGQTSGTAIRQPAAADRSALVSVNTAPPTQPAPTRQNTHAPINAESGKISGEVAINDSVVTSPDVSTKSGLIVQAAAEEEDPNSPIVAGHIEMIGGLAVLGDQTELSIVWKGGGKTVARSVSQRTGEFRFHVPSIRSGKLFAYLRDEHEHVLGRGDYDLDGAATDRQSLLQGLTMIIEPAQSGVGGTMLSAYSTEGNPITVSRVNIKASSLFQDESDAQGKFQLAGLSADSSYLAEVEGSDMWGLRMLIAADASPKLQVFSHKMIQSLLDITGHADAADSGVVWGEVRDKSGPTGGAVVALSTDQAIGPIYFNALRIPDKRLTATTDNGLFAFIKVKSGLHIVMSEKNKKELPSSVVSVAPGYVSYARLESQTVQVGGNTIDGVEQTPVKSKIVVVGASGKTKSNERGRFSLTIPSSDSVLFVEGRSGKDYAPSRMTVSKKKTKNLTIPLFKKAWIDQQLQNAQADQRADNGVVLGFVNGSGFHVALDNEPDYLDNNIFYFNDKGVLEPGLIEGSNGGGFMLANVPPGLHTLLIYSSDGDLTATKLIVSQKGILNVVGTKFTLQ